MLTTSKPPSSLNPPIYSALQESLGLLLPLLRPAFFAVGFPLHRGPIQNDNQSFRDVMISLFDIVHNYVGHLSKWWQPDRICGAPRFDLRLPLFIDTQCCSFKIPRAWIINRGNPDVRPWPEMDYRLRLFGIIFCYELAFLGFTQKKRLQCAVRTDCILHVACFRAAIFFSVFLIILSCFWK